MNDPIVNERTVSIEADLVMNLENLIKNHIVGIDKLIAELREKREMFDDSFNNDPVYREKMDKVKEVTKDKNSVRSVIASKPDVSRMAQELKDLRFDLKEKKATLSELLLDYKEKTKATQLELFDGEFVDIVQTARVVKSAKK